MHRPSLRGLVAASEKRKVVLRRFSIVIPVFNVEPYLRHCIDSVLGQSQHDFELLLVDDGSTDASGTICDLYAARDGRIVVEHRTNSGVSDARNRGLATARGKYVVFLDGDDYLAEGALTFMTSLIDDAEEPDMITCAHNDVLSDGTTLTRHLPFATSERCIDRNTYYQQISAVDGVYWAPWQNVYRREIIYRNSIEFDSGVGMAEDLLFFAKFIACADRFAYLDEPAVAYRVGRAGSAMQTRSVRQAIERLESLNTLCEAARFDQRRGGQLMAQFYAKHFARVVLVSDLLVGRDDDKCVAIYIRDHSSALSVASGLEFTIAKLAWNLLGYRRGSVMLRSIHAVWHCVSSLRWLDRLRRNYKSH